LARLSDIRLRRSAVSGSIPSISNLNLGELALNTADGKVYMKKSVGGTDSVVEVGGANSGIASTFTAYEYTATANQTTFSGSDNYSNTLAYNTGTPPKVQVFMNGILLDEGSSADYTGTNGTSVVLTTGADAGDLVQIHAYKSDVSVSSNINLGDNKKLQFGDAQDLQIYHDSSNSYIRDVGTGNLIIEGSSQLKLTGPAGDYFMGQNNGSAYLYHAGSLKLYTTSTGVQTTGTVNVNGAYALPTSDGSAGQALVTNGSGVLSFATVSGGAVTSMSDTDGDTKIQFEESSDEDIIRFDTGGIERVRVGIDSSSDSTLEIVRTGVPAARGQLTFNGSGLVTDVTSGYHSLIVRNAGSEHFRINSSGNVGIGTTGPNRKLHISGSGATVAVKVEATDGVQSSLDLKNSEGEFRLINDGGALSIYDQTDTAERFRIDTSGNVGIGTTSPASKLHVSDGGAGLEVNPQTANDRVILFAYDRTASTYQSMNLDATDFRFNPSGTERMRIDSAGNVLVGKTSSSFSTAGVELASGGTAGKVQITRDGGSPLALSRKTSDGAIALFYKDTTQVGSIGSHTSTTTNMYIGSVDSGLYFDSTNNRISPYYVYNNSLPNGGISLGGNGNRFQDLYLAGSVTTGDGTAASPAIKVGDNDTGLFQPTDNVLAFSAWGTERMRIDSQGRVGINNTSPSSQYFNNLVVGDNSAGDKGITIRTSSSNMGVLAFSDTDSANAGRYDGYIAYHHNGSSMRFNTNGGNERMRLDALGNLLVATTDTTLLNNTSGGGFSVSSNGFTQIAKQGVDNADPVLILNQTGVEGETLRFYKDGGIVGSIGSNSDALYISSPYGTDSGLKFASSIIAPSTTTGANRDAAIDLGYSSSRFKDLHLSGTANANALDIKSGTAIHGTITTSSSSLTLNARNTGILLFQSGGSEKMRLSGGNLLVGTTSVSTATQGIKLRSDIDAIAAVADGQSSGYFGRLNSDGDILNFRKDSTTVGSIQARGGDLVIGTGDTGIRFNDAANAVMPHHATDVVNNQIDIGHATYKFKDLYLAGKAYVGSMNVDAGNADGIKISSTAPYLFFNDTDTSHSYDGSISQSGTTLYVGGATPAQGIVFRNKASFGESARFDVNGNLLVGTTSAANASAGFRAYAGGNGAFTRASTVLDLNRLSTDGVIIQFQKDTVNVGSIGTVSNGKLMMGVGSSSSGTNLIFADAFDEIYPSQNGATTLGDPGAKFKDLYLAGKAHIGHAVIDDYAVNTSATSAAQVDTFAAATFRTARYTIQITNTTDNTYHVTELLLIHDGTTPSITEYGTIYTGSAAEATFDADIVSGNVRLLATPASSDAMQFKVVRHSILV